MGVVCRRGLYLLLISSCCHRNRLEMLKFPSDFNINASYYELEETADDVISNINDLIAVTQQARSSRELPEECIAGGNQRVVLRRQRSLSEPSLGVDGDVAMDTPPVHPQSPLLGSKVTEYRPESGASQNSSGLSLSPRSLPLSPALSLIIVSLSL